MALHQIPVSTADPSELTDGAVAEYRVDASGNVTILISSHARPEHVAEALAHEFAELNHLLKMQAKSGKSLSELVNDSTTGPGALNAARIKPDSTLADVRDALTAHDYGRIAQLDFIADRNKRGLPHSDTDASAALDHLGLTTGDSLARHRLGVIQSMVPDLISQDTVDWLRSAVDVDA